MLCDECGNHEAKFGVSVIVNGESTLRHLCPECFEKLNSSFSEGNVKNLLASIMAAIAGVRSAQQEARSEEELPPEEDVTCPCCSTRLSQFKRTGRLGCPDCYSAFREQLQPMLEQIHGRVQHVGRVPLNTVGAQRTRTRREELQRAMEQAVAVEDFETAAQLRDQLRSLTAGEVRV